MYKYVIHYTVGRQVRKKALAVFVLRACFNTTIGINKKKFGNKTQIFTIFPIQLHTQRANFIEGTMGSRFTRTCCVWEMHDCETFGYAVHLIKFLQQNTIITAYK